MDYKNGQIIWRDLTIGNTETVKDFYQAVMGWEFTDHDMGEYNDYNVLIKETQEVFSGICHDIGVNDDMPPVWVNYVYVEDFDSSLSKIEELNGEILVNKTIGDMRFAVLKDPMGAVIAIMH